MNLIDTNADELPMGATIFTGAGSPELVVGLGEPSETDGIEVSLLDVGGVRSTRVVPVDDVYIAGDGFTYPTVEQTRELLRAPYETGTAGDYGLSGFGVTVDKGDPVEYRTYCNDPTYAEIRLRDETGTVVGIFTESWDRIAERDRTGRIRRSDQIGSGTTGSRGDQA